MKNDKSEDENMRKKLWCDVYLAVARAENCVTKSSPESWAKYAIESYDRQFKKEQPHD
jgi:hypothetical protein